MFWIGFLGGFAVATASFIGLAAVYVGGLGRSSNSIWREGGLVPLSPDEEDAR